MACGWPLDGYRKVTEVLIGKISDVCKLLMLTVKTLSENISPDTGDIEMN